MVVSRNGDQFFGPFLTNDVLVQFLLYFMRSRNVVNGKDGFAGILLFLFDPGPGLTETAAVSEDISQIQDMLLTDYPDIEIINI